MTTSTDLIEMDTAGVRDSGTTILAQALRAADAMGIHFESLGSTSASVRLCDLWDSSIPGLTEELGRLGDEVLTAVTAALAATNEVLLRANQLEADQARVAASSGITTVSMPGFVLGATEAPGPFATTFPGFLLGPSGPASSYGSLVPGIAPGSASGALLGSNSFIDNLLAPDGTDFVGRDSSGQKIFEDDFGREGTLGQMHRDTTDRDRDGDLSELNKD